MTSERAKLLIKKQSHSSNEEFSGTAVSKHAVGFFLRHSDVECVIDQLKEADISLDQIALVAKDTEQLSNIAGVAISDRLDANKFNFLADRASFLQNRVDNGDYLFVVSGSDDQIKQASVILNHCSIQEFKIYSASDADRHSSDTVIQGDREISTR